jgi:hypothetical protein
MSNDALSCKNIIKNDGVSEYPTEPSLEIIKKSDECLRKMFDYIAGLRKK